MPSAATPSTRRQRGLQAGSFSPSTSRYPDPHGKNIPSTITALSPRLGPMTPNEEGKAVAPRMITPSLQSNEPSWEDYDEGLFGSANKARRHKSNKSSSFDDVEFQPRRITSVSSDDDEMPMDELLAVTPRKEPLEQTTSRALEPAESLAMPIVSSNIGKITVALESNSFERPAGLNLEERMLWDAVQSTIINALRRSQKANAPVAASAREKELEKKLAATEAKVDNLLRVARNFETSSDIVSSGSVNKVAELEEKLRESEMMLQAKDSEHDVELRAIQRVLAEISVEHEDETQVLTATVATLSNKIAALEKEKAVLQSGLPPPPPPPMPAAKRDDVRQFDSSAEVGKLKEAIKALESENATVKKEAERKARYASLLERDFKTLKSQVKNMEDAKKGSSEHKPNAQVDALISELEKTKERNLKLLAELDAANKDRKSKRKPFGSMTPPRPEMTSNHDCESVASSMSAEDMESLQKNLSETTSSLENAKKIIASLENANGSMAVDLRAKLKAKEDEVASLQKESAERKRRLDSLATELRDLQRKHDDIERLQTESRNQLVRHKALMGLLEKSVSGLQAASAINEVSTTSGDPDHSNVEQISEILTDAMLAIRTSLEMSEQYIDEFDDETTIALTDVEVSSEVGRQIDAIIKNDREALAENLKNELDQKRFAVRRLEEALQKQNEEIRRLRREHTSSGGTQELLEEIKNLREQCSANMEIVAKKDLELSVLRSSLKVDESDGGYISDDASEGEDENNSSIPPEGAKEIGPSSHTEALPTILTASGSMQDADSTLKNELLKALEEKTRTTKELQSERDSLANAKLLISSLGTANQSMMEDLRSRLQESNATIASLLDQSSQNEKTSNTLREEVERLKAEKERLENQLLKGAPGFHAIDPLPEEKKEEPEIAVDGASS